MKQRKVGMDRRKEEEEAEVRSFSSLRRQWQDKEGVQDKAATQNGTLSSSQNKNIGPFGGAVRASSPLGYNDAPQKRSSPSESNYNRSSASLKSQSDNITQEKPPPPPPGQQNLAGQPRSRIASNFEPKDWLKSEGDSDNTSEYGSKRYSVSSRSVSPAADTTPLRDDIVSELSSMSSAKRVSMLSQQFSNAGISQTSRSSSAAEPNRQSQAPPKPPKPTPSPQTSTIASRDIPSRTPTSAISSARQSPVSSFSSSTDNYAGSEKKSSLNAPMASEQTSRPKPARSAIESATVNVPKSSPRDTTAPIKPPNPFEVGSDLDGSDSGTSDSEVEDAAQEHTREAVRLPPTPSKDVFSDANKAPPVTGAQKRRPPPPPPSLRSRQKAKATSVPAHQSQSERVEPSLTIHAQELPPSLPPRPTPLQNQKQSGVIPRSAPPPLPPRQDSGPSPTIAVQSSSIATASPHRSNADSVGGPVKLTTPVGQYVNPNLLAPTDKSYPILTDANRRPPLLESPNGAGARVLEIPNTSRSPLRTCAVSSSTLAIASHQVRLYRANSAQYLDTVTMAGNPEVRVTALLFAPSYKFTDEGRYLWVGQSDGSLLIYDVYNNEIIQQRTNAHKASVTQMLIWKNTQIWTIDDEGVTHAWPVLGDEEGNMWLDGSSERYRVAVRPHIVITVPAPDGSPSLWMSSNRDIECFTGMQQHNMTSAVLKGPSETREITALTILPDYAAVSPDRAKSVSIKVYAGHDDGKVTVWDRDIATNIAEKPAVMNVSLYGISAMLGVGDHHLWVGYKTGMIYIYDVSHERWKVIKAWRAHTSAIMGLHIDRVAMINGEGQLRVLSWDRDGMVKIWDGLLQRDWQDSEMSLLKPQYCTYRPINVLVCSWNIDANKPEKLDARWSNFLVDWLTGSGSPDIIAIGIQEIIDLESKKASAKSFFTSKRKNVALPEEDDPNLHHRYRLWHDQLVEAVGMAHGYNAYTVLKTEHLVGLFSLIFVKSTDLHLTSCKGATLVKTGMMGLHGNKGGVAIRFLFEHTSICFVNCHLAAGQSHVKERNEDAENIFKNALFEETDYADIFVHGGDGSQIMDHDLCILSGDLNYRIELPPGVSRDTIIEKIQCKLNPQDKQQNRQYLLTCDQLTKQRLSKNNQNFRLRWFNEAPIEFDPTYKFNPGEDIYDSSEKKRIPAWCDRILYRAGPDVATDDKEPTPENATTHSLTTLYYTSHPCNISDHKPISAEFIVRTKVMDAAERDDCVAQVESHWSRYLSHEIDLRKSDYLRAFGVGDVDGMRGAEHVDVLMDQYQGDVGRILEQWFSVRE